MRTWAVVPAFREAHVIPEVVRGLRLYAEAVVVVDDGSADGTAEAAAAAGAHVLRHAVNRGYGAALITGTTYAFSRGAEAVVHVDGDGQHVPEDVPKLMAALKPGEPSVALGSRFRGQALGLPFSRRIILQLGRFFTWLHSGILLSDAHNGLRAFTREAWAGFRFTQDRMAFSSEVVDEISRTRTVFVEVPVTVRYTAGTLAGSKQGRLPALRIVRDLVFGRLVR